MKLTINTTPEQDAALEIANIAANPQSQPPIEEYTLGILDDCLSHVIANVKQNELDAIKSKLDFLSTQDFAAVKAVVNKP